METRIKRPAFWGQVALALTGVVALVVAAVWTVGGLVDWTARGVTQVRCAWEGETLRFTSLQGGVVLSYLQSRSGETPVAARLPAPVFILDSAPARLDQATWNALVWRDDAGSIRPAPPVGEPVTGLYTRLERTR